MPIDVLCAGLIVADHVCAPIAQFPPAGGLVTTDRLELTTGGCAANVAVDLAKLGLRASIAGRIGNDVLGRFVTETLSSQGVDCSTISISETAQTSGTLVVNVAGEDRRFLHAVGANAEFTGLEIPESVLRGCRAIYVGGFGLNPALSGANVARLFRAARAAGVVTVLDVVVGQPDRLPPMLVDALPETDLFLPNTDEARLICSESDPLRQARHFRDLGARSVIVTLGGDGLLLVSDTDRLVAQAYPVRAVDGTGGGDAFVSGYLYGLLRPADACQRLAYGSAMGMSCVRAMGATTGVFSANELERFVAEHPLSVRNID
ncbi:MAG: carbohydrate kinase family protein [Planctomycetaceae bacterium]